MNNHKQLHLCVAMCFAFACLGLFFGCSGKGEIDSSDGSQLDSGENVEVQVISDLSVSPSSNIGPCDELTITFSTSQTPSQDPLVRLESLDAGLPVSIEGSTYTYQMQIPYTWIPATKTLTVSARNEDGSALVSELESLDIGPMDPMVVDSSCARRERLFFNDFSTARDAEQDWGRYMRTNVMQDGEATGIMEMSVFPEVANFPQTGMNGRFARVLPTGDSNALVYQADLLLPEVNGNKMAGMMLETGEWRSMDYRRVELELFRDSAIRFKAYSGTQGAYVSSYIVLDGTPTANQWYRAEFWFNGLDDGIDVYFYKREDGKPAEPTVHYDQNKATEMNASLKGFSASSPANGEPRLSFWVKYGYDLVVDNVSVYGIENRKVQNHAPFIVFADEPEPDPFVRAYSHVGVLVGSDPDMCTDFDTWSCQEEDLPPNGSIQCQTFATLEALDGLSIKNGGDFVPNAGADIICIRFMSRDLDGDEPFFDPDYCDGDCEVSHTGEELENLPNGGFADVFRLRMENRSGKSGSLQAAWNDDMDFADEAIITYDLP